MNYEWLVTNVRYVFYGNFFSIKMYLYSPLQFKRYTVFELLAVFAIINVLFWGFGLSFKCCHNELIFAIKLALINIITNNSIITRIILNNNLRCIIIIDNQFTSTGCTCIIATNQFTATVNECKMNANVSHDISSIVFPLEPGRSIIIIIIIIVQNCNGRIGLIEEHKKQLNRRHIYELWIVIHH